MALKKPKEIARRSAITVRATQSEKSLIRKNVKRFKHVGILSMSDLMLYATLKFLGD